MLRVRSAALLLVAAICWLCPRLVYAQVTPGLNRNACAEIARAKVDVGNHPGNPLAIERLGYLQLGCGVANAYDSADVLITTNPILCYMLNDAGDTLAGAAALQLSVDRAELSQEQRAHVAHLDALSDWTMAMEAYSNAETACLQVGLTVYRATQNKAGNAIDHMAELSRLVGSEIQSR